MGAKKWNMGRRTKTWAQNSKYLQEMAASAQLQKPHPNGISSISKTDSSPRTNLQPKFNISFFAFFYYIVREKDDKN
ncbi:hypothetical protein [Lentibacillus sp. CBA3610]|uniref:hypothetical protein n=1 Tax=Lentibacillus sp. CBA3610 TaxID=2518176 RepID=UPI0015956AC3|nr:hypothetical protein [Lentibacillus sp. CBA3610]